MRYLVWLPLRVGALILLLIMTVSGFLRMLLRGITGCCGMAFILLPIYMLIVAIHSTAATLYFRTRALDVKFGFAKPEEVEGLRERFWTFWER